MYFCKWPISIRLFLSPFSGILSLPDGRKIQTPFGSPYLTCRYLFLLRGRRKIWRISYLQKGSGGGLCFITYSGIALRDLLAAIKSFWFETARGGICAFFLDINRSGLDTLEYRYGVGVGCRWTWEKERKTRHRSLSLSLSLQKPKLQRE